MADHPHGNPNRYRYGPDENDQPGKGCRCRSCTAANTRSMNMYRLALATGRHQRDVDAKPVRRHVRKLQAAGMGTLRIAQLAGVSHQVVRALLYGVPSIGLPPTRRLRPRNAARLLAVRHGQLPPAGYVPVAGSRRRLQALCLKGWPVHVLAAEGGMSVDTLQRLTSSSSQTRMEVETARKVAEVFKRLWKVDPAAAGVPAATVARLRGLAAAKGWLSPLAWDDIDNPAEKPRGVRRVAS
ncbi:hypothetical protein [Nonomuraea sp. NPDC050643]|uniref:hypothetical protein n=1 Tax=Nonomuraea sp. NPDC050643 TaxID=3155660 RepID=UPI0033E83738